MLKNLKLGVKMLGGFLIVAAIVLLVGFFGWSGALQLQGHINEIGEVRLPGIESLLIISEAQTAVDSAENALLSRDIDLQSRQEQYTRISDAWKRAEEARAVYESLPQATEEAREWRAFTAAWDAWKGDHETYLDLSRKYDSMITAYYGQAASGAPSYADAMVLLGSQVKDAQILLGNQIQEWKNILLRGSDPAMYERYLTAFTEQEQALQETLAAAEKLAKQLGLDSSLIENLGNSHAALGEDYRQALAGLERSNPLSGFAVDTAVRGMDRSTAEAMQAVDLYITGVEKEMAILLGEMNTQALRVNAESFAAAEELLLQIVQINKLVADEAISTAGSEGSRVRIIALAGMISGTILALLLGLVLTRAITVPVAKGVAFAQAIALGNFNIALDVEQKDEIGILADALRSMLASLVYKAELLDRIADGDLTVDVKIASEDDGLGISLVKMVDSLNDLLGQVNGAVEQVSAGSDQVSQASQSLSQGATEQASSLEEISSSATQVNSQSRQNAENAVQASKLATQAAGDAEAGNRQMEDLVQAMHRINTSSDEINKVVKVIDDIAFQINLLALNANVEAARAGKYGKGFAVVAEEVRNLAVRAGNAVKETSAMVEESISNIKKGDEFVALTAGQLKSIVDGAGKVANFLDEIALASREQAQAIDQITEGLEQIDQVTQSNTASAEESASASEELAAQGEQLKSLIARFRLKSNAGKALYLTDGRGTRS
jgi:methyl-accepting chemotaxis protein